VKPDTFAVVMATGWRSLTVVSPVFFWIAFTAWVVVAIDSLRAAVHKDR
jgi:hypothetical protein